MLRQAIYDCKGPVALRYPRSGVPEQEPLPEDLLHEQAKLTIACYGTDYFAACEAARLLDKQGICTDVIRLRCIKPLETEALMTSLRKTGRLLVPEQTVANGCVGQELAALLIGEPVRVRLVNFGDEFVTHGNCNALLKQYQLDAEGLFRKAMEEFDFE